MPRNARRPRSLSVIGADPLPDVQVEDVGTVTMTDEQYTDAVRALAALIETWRATAWNAQTDRAELGEADRPLAA